MKQKFIKQFKITVFEKKKRKMEKIEVLAENNTQYSECTQHSDRENFRWRGKDGRRPRFPF